MRGLSAGDLGDVAPAVAAPTLVGVETQTRPRFWGGGDPTTLLTRFAEPASPRLRSPRERKKLPASSRKCGASEDMPKGARGGRGGDFEIRNAEIGECEG